LFFQGQFGARKEKTGKDHGFEQSLLARTSQAGHETIQPKARPCVVEHGQAAVVQRTVELKVLSGKKGVAAQTGGNDVAKRLRKLGNVADGSRARPFGCAKGFANQIGEIGFVLSL